MLLTGVLMYIPPLTQVSCAVIIETFSLWNFTRLNPHKGNKVVSILEGVGYLSSSLTFLIALGKHFLLFVFYISIYFQL